MTDLTDVCWRKSSYSNGNGGDCVEVAFTEGRVAVRDTKDRSRTPHTHTAPAWDAFLAAVRGGEFA